MAFQQKSYRQPQTAQRPQETSSYRAPSQANVEQSQEWVLFAPSQQSATDRTGPTQTAGLSRISDLGSSQSREQPRSSVLEEGTEDGELDSLDEGLHAFREPPNFHTAAQPVNTPLLPTHDGLGTFPTSQILEQLWQHEQHNPKRKHDGHHRRASSLQRRFSTMEEMEVQANEEKRIRIEKWRLEQSRALIQEVERETRRQVQSQKPNEALGTTPKQADFALREEESDPFWRRITRKFIRDVIGIDEPLLSVIMGESLPGEYTPRPTSPALPAIEEDIPVQGTWRDRLLRRIAKELGVFVHQLSPHPGPFTSYVSHNSTADYAGMPVRPESVRQETTRAAPELASTLSPNFPPTLRDPAYAESWGFEEEPSPGSATLNLQKEREYWERELDVKMMFRYIKDRFMAREQETPPVQHDDSATRAAIIRQHHPLVARAHRLQRHRRASLRKPGSSCASESVKSGHRSASSRNYWDLGGSMGSGSLLASGGLMGAWGEV